MIVAPDWMTLRGAFAGLDSQNPIERKKALERLQKLILDELPDVTAVRLYDIDGDVAIIQLASDKPEKSARPLAELPFVRQCLKQRESIWQAETTQWGRGLFAGAHVMGVLVVQVQQLDDEWITWLEVIAGQIAKSLAVAEHSAQPRQEVPTDRLVSTSQMLLVAENYDDVATAAMYSAADNVLAVTLTRFEYPLTLQGNNVVTNNRRYSEAYATREATALVEQADSVSSLPEQSFVESLQRGLPILIDNVDTDAGYLSGWMRDFAANQQCKQLAVFGLISNEQVVGTIEYYMATRAALTDAEIDLYFTIAQQIGTTILSKRLLQQSLESQQFASQLVNTNKAIAEAENYVEMAQAVLHDAPQDIQFVGIALFNRPFTLMGNPSNLRTFAIVSRDDVIDEEFVDYFSAVDDARITYFLHEYLEGRMMMLWNVDRPRQPVLAESLVERLQQENVDVITSFGLNINNALRGLLVFAGTSELRETGQRFNGLRAIADQLAAVIENRILLQQATDALTLIQNQNETSSRVFRSNTLLGMLEAVYDFASRAFDTAQLVTAEQDGLLRMVAEITLDGKREMYRRVSLDDYPASQTLSVLEALEVRDVEQDVFIEEAERQQLMADGIGALVILPIVSNFVVNGLVMLSNATPTRIPPERLRAMRSLVDQVGIVLENRKLLQNTEASLNEIRLLYDINRAMLRTQTMMDVIHIIKNSLAPDAAVICVVTIQYAEADPEQITDIVLELELTATEERMLDETLTTSDEDIAEIKRYLQQNNEGAIFVPKGVIMPGNPLLPLQDRYNIASYAALVTRDRGRITSLIYLLFDTEKSFDESTRRLYDAISDQVDVVIENRNLLMESQRSAVQLEAQVQVMEAISAFAARVNAIQEEDMLLQTGARTLAETIGVEHVGILLFNEDLQTGVIAGEYPKTDVFETTMSTKGNPFLLPDFDLSEAALIENIAESDLITDNLRHDLQRQGVRSLMMVPLVGLNNELIGSVGLDVYSRYHEFTETDVQIAQTIAAQMAVGLQNIRLLMDAQQRAEQLQHITDFSQQAQATLNLNQMIDAALTSVPKLLKASHITITLYDEIREELVLVGGWTQEYGGQSPIEAGEVIKRGGTTTGYVYETGKYLYIPNLRENTSLKYHQSRAIFTLLALPLTNRGRTLGVMTVGSKLADAYSHTDIALFQQLVNQMAVAIDNARAYTQSQRIAENKTLANEISVQLQRQNDITDMIDLTMKEVGRAIGAKRGRIRLSTRREEENDNKG